MAGEFSDAFAFYHCYLFDKESFGDFIFLQKTNIKKLRLKITLNEMEHRTCAFIFDFGWIFHKIKGNYKWIFEFNQT